MSLRRVGVKGKYVCLASACPSFAYADRVVGCGVDCGVVGGWSAVCVSIGGFMLLGDDGLSFGESGLSPVLLPGDPEKIARQLRM